MTPYRRNGGPPSVAVPSTQPEAETTIASGAQFKNTGHTEWPDGRIHHHGFTTTMSPNTNTSCTDGTTTWEFCDFNSWQEGRNGAAGSPSYAIVTSRSFMKALSRPLWRTGLFERSRRTLVVASGAPSGPAEAAKRSASINDSVPFRPVDLTLGNASLSF